MEGSLRTRIIIKAGIILLLTDDFTDSPADTAGFHLESPEGVSLVRKPDGCVVCLNPPPGGFTVSIESPMYEPKTLFIRPEEYAAGCPILRIRLTPGPSYPLSAGAFAITGQAEPGSRVFAAGCVREGAFKLLSDYGQGDGKIAVYHGSRTELSGKRLYMVSAQEKKEALFVAGEEVPGGTQEYFLETPLSQGFRKVGTSLYPVLEGMADASGWYRILMKDVGGKVVGWNQRADGTLVRKEILPDGEKKLRLDFKD